ncbi:MAG: hypothetical protein JWL84_617 [Rhodospirillales bacterium]|jgi:hypothetical protein|nr:hypothetical protein [Rhodospirillales bacterium]
MAAKRSITRADIMDLGEYVKERGDRRRRMAELKRRRRVEVGPFATFYFESYDTMWHQVHEMLTIEKGGEAQIADELEAYNPLIPKGDELVATVMFEIDDERRRPLELAKLGGIEDNIFIRIDDDLIRGRPEGDRENTREEDNKASSVQFAHFHLAPEQIARFRQPGAQVMLGFDHPNYGHIAVLPEDVRAALSDDFA